MNCPWGQKAFKGYFGEDRQDLWKEHDATELVKKYPGDLNVLIDIVWTLFLFPLNATLIASSNLVSKGTSDNFYKQGQLLPENFAAAAKESGSGKGREITIRYQPDHDHSYFTIATFADDHINQAANYLFT